MAKAVRKQTASVLLTFVSTSKSWAPARVQLLGGRGDQAHSGYETRWATLRDESGMGQSGEYAHPFGLQTVILTSQIRRDFIVP